MKTIKVVEGDYYALITYRTLGDSHSYKAAVLKTQDDEDHVVSTITGNSNFEPVPDMETCRRILIDGIEVDKVAKKYGLEGDA